MRAQARCIVGSATVLMVGAVLGAISESYADGDEMLGFIDVADGSDVIMAGVGLRDVQPANIEIVIPDEVSVVQVLLYWSGFALTPEEQRDTDTITVDGNDVTGDRIGGPNFFSPGAYASTYRAELDPKSVAPGPNSIAIDGLDFLEVNQGAGLLVIVDDGANAGNVQVADGSDIAFSGFEPPRQETVPVVYDVMPADFNRVADVSCFAASIAAGPICRPNVLRILVDRVLAKEIENPFASSDGLEWDTYRTKVDIPAGATTVSVQAISANLGNECPPDDPDTGLDASMVWLTSVLGPPVACPEDLDGDGEVAFSDLTTLLSLWGPCPDPRIECPADFDGSGDVGFSDLSRLLAAWGPCPGIEPEPT